MSLVHIKVYTETIFSNVPRIAEYDIFESLGSFRAEMGEDVTLEIIEGSGETLVTGPQKKAAYEKKMMDFLISRPFDFMVPNEEGFVRPDGE